MPDFGEVPNLEKLNLEGCVKLAHMDPSIGVLRKLVFLNLNDCKNLVSIPNNIFGLSSLKDLNLSGCSKVFKNPRHLKRLDTSESALHYWHAPPRAHKDFLPSLGSLSCLRQLDIRFCGLSQLPDDIGCLRGLEKLILGGNNFVILPSLRKLSKLVYLSLEHCKQLKTLPELPSPTVVVQEDAYWRTGEIYVFNCPELGEKERCSSMTLSWMIQFIQANQHVFPGPFPRIEIVLPVISEMPSWFNNQRVGRSISINPFAIIHHDFDNDNHFIGIACCVVISVAPKDPITVRDYEESPVQLDFSKDSAKIHVPIPVIFARDLIAVKSNYMWLIYYTRESFFQFLPILFGTSGNLDGIEMTAICTDNQVKVKSCGYRWVYKQDLQQKHHRNSIARKCKTLAIGDEAQPQSLFISLNKS